ncbi:MAG: sialate O-acetylesterase, partial [Planctomycetes bacterium]|nr:sialate O-acetylesterase [Planctomycetota bacterium]
MAPSKCSCYALRRCFFPSRISATGIRQMPILKLPSWRWIAVLPIAVLLASEQQGRAEDVLLVFAGQSNMEGKGTTNTASKLTEKEKAAIPNVKGFYSNALLDKGKPDPWGLKLYNDKGQLWYNWASWKDKGAKEPLVGGTWQDYAYWKNAWKGAADYDHGDKGEFWYLGLNPGEPWSNAAKFTSGEDVKEYGPEFEVARAVAAARPKDSIYIVKYAPGGTALADQWDLTDSWKGYGAYAAMKQWVDCAIAAKPGLKVGGFFWLQGESDAVKGDHAKDYEANLTELVKKVRKDFDAPKLPVVIAKIHPGHSDRNYGVVWGGGKKGIDTVRAAQAKVAASVGNADIVETNDLKLLTKEWYQKKGKDRKTFNDGVLLDLMDKDKFLAPVHFDADSIRTIGKRMAEAFLNLHGKDTPP